MKNSNPFRRRRASSLRYLSKREAQMPRDMFFPSGNRSYGRPPEADR